MVDENLPAARQAPIKEKNTNHGQYFARILNALHTLEDNFTDAYKNNSLAMQPDEYNRIIKTRIRQ